MSWIFAVILITPAFGFTSCDSFIMNNRRLRHLQAKKKGSTHNWNHEPFDFSSRIGWDNFYKEGNPSDDEQSLENLEYEWHSHMPHSVIVDAIAPTIDAASKYYNTAAADNEIPSILLVGTGNSALPRILHDAFDTPVRVTCLDYSPVCVEMIRSMYADLCPNMDFVLGDATRLKETLNSDKYDVIVDKGLLDALMCGEGFDSDLEKLMAGIDDVLTRREWGMSILVCFQLSKSNREFLIELADCGTSHNPNLFWDFDIPVQGSEKGRATFNLARRCALDEKNRIVNVEHMITDWK
eukprot:scaffold4733_cov119-Skeletonema_marinoi.AAC.4